MSDDRLYYPATARNRDAIGAVIAEKLNANAQVLEIGSGSGEHAIHFTNLRPDLSWHPTDPSRKARQSISAWTKYCNRPTIFAPLNVDVTKEGWTAPLTDGFDVIVAINMVHIAPFTASNGLFGGGANILKSGGILLLYGPFSSNGAHISQSNQQFDASLKARDPAWGVRDIENDLIPLASKNGFRLSSQIPMPSNNQILIFDRSA